MINSYIRIGFIVSENEYEAVCTNISSLFAKDVQIIKTSEYCLINSSILLIRIFKYKNEETISLITKSGRYVLLIISDNIIIQSNNFNLLVNLCNLGNIWGKHFNVEEINEQMAKMSSI